MNYPYHQQRLCKPYVFLQRWSDYGKYDTQLGYSWLSYNLLHKRLRWAKTLQRKRAQRKRLLTQSMPRHVIMCRGGRTNKQCVEALYKWLRKRTQRCWTGILVLPSCDDG